MVAMVKVPSQVLLSLASDKRLLPVKLIILAHAHEGSAGFIAAESTGGG